MISIYSLFAEIVEMTFDDTEVYFYGICSFFISSYFAW